MNKIKGFTFFRSYHEALSELCDRDKKALLIAITNYVFDDITPEFKGTKKCVWTLIEPTLKASKSKAGNAKKKSNQNQNEIKLKSNQNHNSNFDLLRIKDKEKDKDKGNGVRKENKKEKKSSDFSSPTLNDIISYALEMGISDKKYCERFYNYYEAIGWVNASGRKIEKWKLAFANWVNKDKLLEKPEDDRVFFN